MAAATGPVKKDRHLTSEPVRLLEAPTTLAVRRIARRFLNDASRARKRFAAKADDEAIHDFRVALRRLRSTLRTYRPLLERDIVSRKARRRLKRLARAAGAARDADVGLAWLRQAREHLTDAERPACDRLIADWRARRSDAYADLRRRLDKKFDPLAARLGEVFERSRMDADAAPVKAAVGRLMDERIAALGTELQRIKSAADTATIHGARLAAKRLRYLMEPLAAEIPDGTPLLKALKRFQDDFGELSDRQALSEELIGMASGYDGERLERELRATLGDADAERAPTADIAAGLLALARRLRDERRQRYADIEQRYLGQGTEAFLAPYRALADTLGGETPAARAPVSPADTPAAERRAEA